MRELQNYMSLASRYPILTWEQERELATRWREHKDSAAAEQMVLCNLRAVVKIASEFRYHHAAFEDLVQEGNVGLMRAIDHFDPDRGTRFLSYAAWWIRACIKEFLLRTRCLVRIGTTQKQRAIYSRLGRAKRELEERYPDCDPSKRLERLSEILDASPKLVEQMEGRLAGHDLSLHARVDDDSDTMYVDLLTDTGENTEEKTSGAEIAQFRADCLDEAMECLSEKERYIIHRRYLVPTTLTLRELGEQLGISRERVRQLEVRAKMKLRKNLSAKPCVYELLDDPELLEDKVA